MYVRWKVLISLGAIFWSLSCLIDYYWISKHQTTLIEKPIAVEFEESLIEPIVGKAFEPKEETVSFIKIAFWNFIAFLSTVSICFTLKSITKLWCSTSKELLADGYENDPLALKKNNSSKIPIPITGKSSSTDIHIEGGVTVVVDTIDDSNKSCPNLLQTDSSDGERIKHEDKLQRVCSIRNMEKHCAKLRDEMINLQATSLKEHSAISKKMDALIKEKREYIKQINTTKKENKTLKEQLEEMLIERQLMCKRLDCATKEIRINTKSKKITMEKLEEALVNAEVLKTNLEQISKDKRILEDKMILLNAEYTRLREQLELYKESSEARAKDLMARRDTEVDTKEHVIDSYEIPEEVNSIDADASLQRESSDFDISQSEQDMRKVQEKLFSLERSLENFKFRQSNSLATKEEHESLETQMNESNSKSLCLCQEDSMTTIDEEPSSNSICTEPSCPLEHSDCTSAGCFLKNVNHKLQVEDNTDLSSGDESTSPSYTTVKRMLQENLNPKRYPVKYIRSSISDDRLSVISERATNTTADDSGEDYEQKRRFVSRSPEFQNFLKKVREPPPVDTKFEQKLENVLINYCDV